jgi:hypothetical protein
MTNHIKKLALMALFAVLGAFSLLSLGIIRVQADYDYYALHNLIQNGDMSDDINLNGVADNFIQLSNDTYTLSAQGQKVLCNGDSLYAGIYYPNISLSSTHHYYFSYTFITNDVNAYYTQSVDLRKSDNTQVQTIYGSTTKDTAFSTIITSSYTNSSSLMLLLSYSSDIANNIYTYTDNVILIDLTNTFGSGNEPSLADFELYYLPDAWFQDYDSYTPVIYDEITGDDLGNDDTLLDWNTALIGKNGGNITLLIYMYLDYASDSEFDYSIYDVLVYYYGVQYNLHWVQDVTDIHLYTLDLSDDLEYSSLLAVLFDRSFSVDNYASFRIASGVSADQEPQYWLEIRTDFVYNVNIGGVAISTSQTNYNVSCPIIGVWAKFYDNMGDILQPSLYLEGTAEAHLSTLYDTFTGKYNNVQSFCLAFDIPGPDYYDDYPWFQNIHEISVFATDVVILVNPPLDDVIDLFPIIVVEWYDIGGQLKNLFNEVAGKVYTFLHIAEISATFQTFFDAVDGLVDFLPPSVQYLALMVLAMGAIGIIIVIADKHL